MIGKRTAPAGLTTIAAGAAQVCALSLGIAAFGHSAVAGAAIITFEVPGSYDTEPWSMNTQGTVTGFYQDGPGYTEHGFLRTTDGTITSFDTSYGSTVPTGINNHGAITGQSQISKHRYQGFIRSPDGTIATFAFGSATDPTAINDKGIITGSYYRDKKWRGFVRKADGSMKSFQPTDAVDTSPTAINDTGVIAGFYYSTAYHGFVRAKGTITSFDPPGSTATLSVGINKNGVIVGWYNDSKAGHGFMRAPDGTFTTLDAPHSIDTTALAIDKEGEVTGYYLDANKMQHGFFRTVGGEYKTFDPAGSKGTQPVAIAAGFVAGWYGTGDTAYGFLRTK
jgi:hypothetical protein